MEHLVQRAPDGGIYTDLGDVSKPGDVIVLEGGQEPFLYIWLGRLKGEQGNPIKIVNRNGLVRSKGGFNLTDSQEVLIAGDGDSAIAQGFLFDSGKPSTEWEAGAAVSVAGTAKGIEAYRVAANNTGYGVWCKNEPSCDDALNKFVIERVNIHDCLFTNIRIEGMYFGSTNFLKGATNVRPIDCGGVVNPIPPPWLKDIKISNNRFNGTGRAAIQLSYAAQGLSEVSGNDIQNVGREYNDTQGNGINIGSFTCAIVKGNKVRNTLCAGICTFGADTTIEDNDIDLSGVLDDKVTPWAWSIWVDTRETQPFTQARLSLLRNKVGQNGSEAPDILIADQWGLKNNIDGWMGEGNIIDGNVSTVTGQAASMAIDKTFTYTSGQVIQPPSPVKELFKRGYWTIAGKRFYYLNYKDGTWSEANSKYQPIPFSW